MTPFFCTTVRVDMFILLNEDGANIGSAISLDMSARCLIEVGITCHFCRNEGTYLTIHISHSFGGRETSITIVLWLRVTNLNVRRFRRQDRSLGDIGLIVGDFTAIR